MNRRFMLNKHKNVNFILAINTNSHMTFQHTTRVLKCRVVKCRVLRYRHTILTIVVIHLFTYFTNLNFSIDSL